MSVQDVRCWLLRQPCRVAEAATPLGSGRDKLAPAPVHAFQRFPPANQSPIPPHPSARIRNDHLLLNYDSHDQFRWLHRFYLVLDRIAEQHRVRGAASPAAVAARCCCLAVLCVSTLRRCCRHLPAVGCRAWVGRCRLGAVPAGCVQDRTHGSTVPLLLRQRCPALQKCAAPLHKQQNCEPRIRGCCVAAAQRCNAALLPQRCKLLLLPLFPLAAHMSALAHAPPPPFSLPPLQVYKLYGGPHGFMISTGVAETDEDHASTLLRFSLHVLQAMHQVGAACRADGEAAAAAAAACAAVALMRLLVLLLG